MAEINEKKRYNPSLLELKPNVHISEHSAHHKYSPHHSQQSYQPLKFRPIAEIKDFKPSYQMNHGEIVVGSSHGSSAFSPSTPSQKPKTVIKLKKPEVKKVRLITPGLKQYASAGTKLVARNDYSNYFRSRFSQEDQRDASHRMSQHLYRRNPRALLMPQYAPYALNYDSL